MPNRIGRLKLAEPYTTRNWQYSLYVRDQWQASSRMTVSYGTRWEYFPVPTRATRGLERYNVNIFRQFDLPRAMNLQVRMEAFNVTNRPRFSNPGANVSNLRLNLTAPSPI